jgi:hypothetical protein
MYRRNGHESRDREWSNNSSLSLISAPNGVGVQLYTPAALPSGKIRYPLYRRLGGPQGRPGQVWNISPRTVQPVKTALSRSTVQGNFIEFSRRESFRLYESVIVLRGTLSHGCRPNVIVRLSEIERKRVRNTRR